MDTLRRSKSSNTMILAALAWGLAAAAPASAQSPSGSGGDFPIRDSSVGYIDDAIPGNKIRFRYDTAYNNNRPSRGEYFYARGNGLGPGLPLTETRVDYQEASAYMEMMIGESCSMFCEVPSRFLNPEINANHSGLSDVNAGMKYAVIENDTGVWTLQFRTYAPTGDAQLGLGTRHVSLEPAVLFFLPINEALAVEGECRYWIPIGDAGFGGDLIRYGIGVEWTVFQSSKCRVTPVVETVGWTFLHGAQSIVLPNGFFGGVEDATGDTIVNVKAGVRMTLGEHFDIYGGWGHPLTGDQFYENTYRFELRFLF